MPEGTPELEILVRLTAGEERAQRQVVERYFPRMYRVIRSRLGLSPQDAEEVAFEVLADFLLEPSRFDPTRGVRLAAWLVRIARNRAIDRLRRTARAPREVSIPASLGRVQSQRRPPGPAHAGGLLLAALCAELPPSQRAALEWHANGLSYAVIAGWLGRNEPAIRQAVSRGKRTLRDRFRAELERCPPELRARLRAVIRDLRADLEPGTTDPQRADPR